MALYATGESRLKCLSLTLREVVTNLATSWILPKEVSKTALYRLINVLFHSRRILRNRFDSLMTGI
jgi:hypothetical protein